VDRRAVLGWRGIQLFMDENDNDGVLEAGEGAMCSAGHVAEWTEGSETVVVRDWSPDGSIPPLFTDVSFDNLGVPKSDHSLLADAPVDRRLGDIVGNADEDGKLKEMTLRNVAVTKPYAHNGTFKTLKEITHLYYTRDVPGALKKGRTGRPPRSRRPSTPMSWGTWASATWIRYSLSSLIAAALPPAPGRECTSAIPSP
jgi:cytochrome c peroxidase